jgi:hypothetical protein
MKLGGVVISADDFFMKNGVYEYDRLEVANNHVKCKNTSEFV